MTSNVIFNLPKSGANNLSQNKWFKKKMFLLKMSKQEVFSLKSTKVTANNLENIKRAMRISIYVFLKYINIFERTFL